MRGFLVLDKPAGPTSHDMVGILRAVSGVRRVGHTGTLDPFATGVLPLAFGHATRLIQYLDESLKEYEAELKLGLATETGDPEGEVVEQAEVPSLEGVAALFEEMQGTLTQRPPPYSAVKIDGKPLYAYAREGNPRHGNPREIQVLALERLPHPDPSVLRFRVRCSRGTYVRVLGIDIARALGSVGHLQALRRTRSGSFEIADSVSMAQVAELATGSSDWALAFHRDRDKRLPRIPREQVQELLSPHLVTIEKAFASWPVRTVDVEERGRVLNGICPSAPSGLDVGERYLVSDGQRTLAVAEQEQERVRLLRVLPDA